jgi:hypothetical protein
MTFIIQNTSSNKISITQKLSRLIAIAGKLTLEVASRQRMKSTIGKLSAKDLRDVGLTENDLLSVQNLKLSNSASELLRADRQNRIGNW